MRALLKSIAPISLGWATDLGQTHHTNEDSYACFPAPLGPVLLVCDGMGGICLLYTSPSPRD